MRFSGPAATAHRTKSYQRPNSAFCGVSKCKSSQPEVQLVGLKRVAMDGASAFKRADAKPSRGYVMIVKGLLPDPIFKMGPRDVVRSLGRDAQMIRYRLDSWRCFGRNANGGLLI